MRSFKVSRCLTSFNFNALPLITHNPPPETAHKTSDGLISLSLKVSFPHFHSQYPASTTPFLWQTNPPRLTPAGSGAISFPFHQTKEANRLVLVQKKTPLTAALNFKLKFTGGLEHDIIRADANAVTTCETIFSVTNRT
jgi:hypothetical protein